MLIGYIFRIHETLQYESQCWCQWKVAGDDDGVTGDSDMGDHELAPLASDTHPGDREHLGGYSDHDREMSYDRDQKYMGK